MARGTLYCVMTTTCGEMSITNADQAAMVITSNEAEWYEDGSNSEEEIEGLIKMLHGEYEKLPGEKPMYKVVFPECCGVDYFRQRWGRFRQLIEGLSLEAFESKSTWELESVLNDRYSDAVVDEYGYVVTLDAWIRDLVPGEPYYIYNTILMH